MPVRQTVQSPGGLSGELNFEQYSDSELETLLFSEEPQEAKSGTSSIQTMLGFATLLIGVLYVLSSGMAGLFGFVPRVEGLVAPTLLVAIATILVTVLRGRKKTRKPKAARKAASGIQIKPEQTGATKRLMKSRDKKITGVGGGIAEYFGLDPKIVRILLVIAAFVSQGLVIPAYLILAVVLPSPPPLSLEDRIRIIRDS